MRSTRDWPPVLGQGAKVHSFCLVTTVRREFLTKYNAQGNNTLTTPRFSRARNVFGFQCETIYTRSRKPYLTFIVHATNFQLFWMSHQHLLHVNLQLCLELVLVSLRCRSCNILYISWVVRNSNFHLLVSLTNSYNSLSKILFLNIIIHLRKIITRLPRYDRKTPTTSGIANESIKKNKHYFQVQVSNFDLKHSNFKLFRNKTKTPHESPTISYSHREKTFAPSINIHISNLLQILSGVVFPMAN